MRLPGKQSVFLRQTSGQVEGRLSSGECPGGIGTNLCIPWSLENRSVGQDLRRLSKHDAIWNIPEVQSSRNWGSN